MKPLIASVGFLLLLSGRAETFIISQGETNSIVVATNEAIIVDFFDTNSRYPLHRKAGVSNIVEIVKGSAFAGPCELVFFDYSTVVTFHRIQTSAITTVVLGASDTNTVVVPTNRTLKIFATDGSGSNVAVSRGTHSRNIPVSALRSGCELTGPLTITLTGESGILYGYPSRQAFSYYLTEDFLEITADGYLKGPSGTFEVVVEKSIDLTQWLPVVVQNTSSSDTRAFYRLRIQK